jgi:DNA polymerase-3 subunit alpha
MRPKSDFVHLHAHSDYSLLDGMTKIPAMVARAREFGMPALALTDHGALFGAIEFYFACLKAGVKPVLGLETYVTRSSRHDRRREDETYHLVLLARDATGYRNLVRLSSLAYTEGFYYRPRVDRELLEAHHEGLIALSACLSGEVGRFHQDGNYEEARRTALWYRDLFGPANYYLEIQNHGLEAEARVREGNLRLARDTGIPLVATQDFHYLDRADAEAHDVLLAVGTGKPLDDPNRLRFDGDSFYFTSGEEMDVLFAGHEEALDNTLAVADRVDIRLATAHRLPRFPLPPGFDSDVAYLRHLAEEGLTRRYGVADASVRARFEYELETITRLGFASYFLIVWDFIAFARSRGIGVGPGRGSVAGSLVAYCLGITDVDPIRFELLFERFLNPERVSLPDIDLDFEDARRGEVIEHVVQKYGAESVAQIITFGTMGAKAVLRDAARVIGLSFAEGDRIAKLVPEGPGVDLEKAIEQSPDLKALPQRGEPYAKLLRCARRLVGVNRHASVHAAGVLIAPGPLVESLPLYRTNKGEITTQFDMRACERIGLLKMDILGLRTMSILDETVRLVAAGGGPAIELEKLVLDDPETFELLGRAETAGVFQLESGGMRDLLLRLKPRNFEDISAVVALYRPGPLGSEMIPDFIDRRHGRRSTRYDLPELEPILRDTYGVIVYQEQVMQIAHRIAGFSMGRADLMRRAMGKKDPVVMAAQKTDFVAGAVSRGVSRGTAEKLFDLVAHFAGYGFNKSHTAAYALLAYRTAWLKAHYPAEFLAATLTAESGNTDRVAALVQEARRLGIPLRPPDVNASEWRFTLEDGEIRFGLAGIKNVGRLAVARIEEARAEGGAYLDILDFCRRVGCAHLNRRTLESLVCAGALDAMSPSRAALFAAAGPALERAQRAARLEESGQESLFGGGADGAAEADRFPLPGVPPWSAVEAAAREKEVLGFFISEHPLAPLGEELRVLTSSPLAECLEREEGAEVRAAGLVRGIRKSQDRRGNEMAFVTLEDPSGQAECLVFSDLFVRYRAILVEDALVWTRARVSRREGEAAKLVANDLLGWDEARGRALALHLDLGADALAAELAGRLDEILARHGGETPVYLHLVEGGGRTTVLRSRKYRVQVSNRLTESLCEVLGPGQARWAPRL